MDVKGMGGYSAIAVRQIGDLRGDLEEAVRQLGSGRKADTYAGIGADRAVALAFKSRLGAINTYKNTIDLVDTRIQISDQTLTRLNSLLTELKAGFDPSSYTLLSDGRSQQQSNARIGFNEYIDLLNTQVAGTRIFGGRASDKDPVAGADEILYGTGSKAGFKQVMSERQQADLGSDGRGRVAVSQPTTSSVSLAEDGTHPFGFKLDGLTSSLTNATVTAPAGTPPALSVDLSAGQPNVGEKLRITLKLPDGTKSTIELTAGTTADPANGIFAIGTTTDDTAASLASVLNQQLLVVGKTGLKAASNVAAANDFFDTYAGKAPKRVDGPPFATATALKDGTAADTVAWYLGENTAAPSSSWSPRQDVQVDVDNAVKVDVGMRANEVAFSWNLRQLAVLSVADVSGNDATAKAYNNELVTRARINLSEQTDKPTIKTVGIEIATAAATAKSAKDRHNVSAGAYQTFVDGAEGIDQNEVATKLAALQTRLQASYQATSILYKMSLTNYM